jgi:hypothetical protein
MTNIKKDVKSERCPFFVKGQCVYPWDCVEITKKVKECERKIDK